MSKGRKKTGTGVKKITQFEIIRPNVAGIDVSDNDTMMVASFIFIAILLRFFANYKLVERRKEKGISQREIADKLCMDVSCYN